MNGGAFGAYRKKVLTAAAAGTFIFYLLYKCFVLKIAGILKKLV